MGFFQSLYLLKKYKIDVLFCKGGYVALPVSFAAKFLWIRVLMHESDMHAGVVNRLVARFAETVFTGFEWVFQKEEIVWQILSWQLWQRKNALIKEKLNLEDKKTTILVMWGSQGAAKIFDVILWLLGKEKGWGVQFLILLWTKNSGYKKLFEKYKNVESFGFLWQKDLAYLYAMSDIAFTRGSVTSLSEQALFGIKKIIIPLPFSGGNHQFYNAIKYSELYEDIVVEQNDRLEENVAMFLEKFGGYKKNWKEVDNFLLIRAKEVIWKKLFKLDKE